MQYKQSKLDINGIETEILCMVFGDVINITVTQLNKIGCMVTISDRRTLLSFEN